MDRKWTDYYFILNNRKVYSRTYVKELQRMYLFDELNKQICYIKMLRPKGYTWRELERDINNGTISRQNIIFKDDNS